MKKKMEVVQRMWMNMVVEEEDEKGLHEKDNHDVEDDDGCKSYLRG